MSKINEIVGELEQIGFTFKKPIEGIEAASISINGKGDWAVRADGRRDIVYPRDMTEAQKVVMLRIRETLVADGLLPRR